MLGKLVKHEWKAITKPLAIMHIALILMAIIGKVLLNIEVLKKADYVWGALLMLYILAVITLEIGTQIYLAVRFYKNMYTDEGYLSFTLPVKSWEHILSKTFISAVWTLIDIAVVILSILILVMYKGMGTEFIEGFLGVLTELSEAGISVVWFMIRLIINGVLYLIALPLTYYFSISIGQLFNSHKMLASIITYFITINVIQVIGTVVSTIMMVNTTYADDVITDSGMRGFYNGILDMGMIGNLITCVGFWLVVNYIMNKRLNLE